MEEYRRPTIAPVEFRDDDGRVIPYGSRWGGDSPPEETYSVETHRERFAPVTAVVESLVDYLARTYEVDVTRDTGLVAELPESYQWVTHATRLTPASQEQATLTFFCSTGPVLVSAGALWLEPFPVCTCDACDETWEDVARDVEEAAFAIASGGFRESLTPRTYAWSLAHDDGARSSTGPARSHAKEARAAASVLLRPLAGGAWRAWTPRS